MFYSFFGCLAMSIYLSFFLPSFNFTLWSNCSFLFYWISQGLVIWPRLGVPFVSLNPKEVYASHSSGMCLCHISICCITVIHIQLYTYTCGNKINNNDERTHFFRKIYLSHFIRTGCERVMCERWVGDWTDCNILAPSSSVFSSTSFSFCWAA